MIKKVNRIVISRTDSIGDVALTLPMAGILKTKFPDATIIFLGNTYTEPIINCSSEIEEVWCWADLQKMEEQAQIKWLKNQNIDVFIHVFPRREIARLAQKAKIKYRIGTAHRLFHLLTCNYRVNFSRKNSMLHESQLNIKLLAPFGITKLYPLKTLSKQAQFNRIPTLPQKFKSLLSTEKKNLIFHPKSKGSALEWGVDNFIALSKKLSKYELFFTGTEEEAASFREKLPDMAHIHDLSGKMSLEELIAFIHAADGLMAASTGPLHIAGLSNIKTIGLFTPRKPLHFGRWQPLGDHVLILEEKTISERNELLNIEVDFVQKAIERFLI
ncbi:glycosyl transferase family 9 [Putridiphycobacter roseus]|uniref:Glycosyl transferase family 9 n=1 Tax=Putridiphycobacter roseus TaxID=2219161 RepID=A0A2W1NM37_9FLAO|nr:glycosyltransferase family 9 protein [Putridiphycobacter roseus]PZE18926.1 glycosyl transferase family 9 [Putridiphycobacter roseus]